LTANPSSGDPHFNITLGIAMLIGRFMMIVPILALAGNLASKRSVPASVGTFQTEGMTFIVLLVGTVVLIGALTFLPALAMGPIVEHFLMGAGTLF
jgi:K+-transporting ATPase ATPase A chain